MKVWVTRYALSTGLREVEAEESHVPSMVCVRAAGRTDCFHGNDWHIDEQSAILFAEGMRMRKIKSLEKQIDRLRKIEFKPKEKAPTGKAGA